VSVSDDRVPTAPAEPEAPAADPGPRRRRAPPAGTLVVVESPAKAKTLKRFLGPGFAVLASSGHVKDLPAARLGVDVARGFAPEYELIRGKSRVLSDLKRAARGAERVLLATDPDREGEAIAWHLAEELAAPGDPRVGRVLLHELTPAAITHALAEPRPVDRARFEAQQARRILDRLVGFQVSPLLWKKIRRGLSAGRVQSVAVRLVVDREREIEAFVAEERWSVTADVGEGRGAFQARAVAVDGRPLDPRDGTAARALAAELGGAALRVERVERAERTEDAPPPYTTARLQQDAARRLGLSPRRTMSLAQRLFEGVELGDEGPVGLLSYPRTDSVRLAEHAIEAVRAHVAAVHGPDHLPPEPNRHRGASHAQGAHEAIRPADLAWTPERVAAALGPGERDLVRLYRLVWARTVACQMAPAIHARTEVELTAGRATLRAGAEALRFAGWRAAWAAAPGADEDASLAGEGAPEPPRKNARPLPPLEPGATVAAAGAAADLTLTAPPPRFDEATLVADLEARGLARPSTFAAIVDAIQEKGYVERVEKRLRPTPTGVLVTDELVRAFPRELDPGFTAALEARLDAIEDGGAAWQDVLGDFHAGFQESLARAEAAMRDVKRPKLAQGLACEQCGRPMAVRWGRRGEFLACTGYPECRHTADVRRVDGGVVPVKDEALATEPCPLCGAAMQVKRGRFGKFLACAKWPSCKGARPVPTGVPCPDGCGGEVTERRSRMGKAFFGCSRFPACNFVSWDRPRHEPCPRCGNGWTVEKVGRRSGPFLACPRRECGHRTGGDGGEPGPAPA
jgi:DNA topoisomerase I